MKYDINQAWKEAYKHLKGVLPDHAIHAWFDPIVPISFNDGVIVLGVPSQFFLEWIDSHYSDHIERVLKRLYGPDIKYRFVVKKSQSEIIKNESIEKALPKKAIGKFNNLNSKYTFDKFIVGDNNAFAKTASESVSKNPGENNFNPLIIYGGVGLGKTHLMHAIGNNALEKFPSLKIVNITSEQFTLDFVNSLRKNKTIEFAQNYRSADILLIDDIQFFRGKEQTQEQFFHTFNVLHQSGKQIVLTADKFPGEMKGL